MSEKNKDLAEYIENEIKHETNKLIDKFLEDWDNVRDYVLDHTPIISGDIYDLRESFIKLKGYIKEKRNKWEAKLKS